MQGPIIRCEVRRGCRTPARVQVEVCGVKSSEREPVNTCRKHLSIVVVDFLTVSNDVRVRSAV